MSVFFAYCKENTADGFRPNPPAVEQARWPPVTRAEKCFTNQKSNMQKYERLPERRQLAAQTEENEERNSGQTVTNGYYSDN